ncbi:hypothetical protein KC573_02495, partial [candidate division WWE3 bacterium]|nr:hypothetical protein [candidate division WWE3 bacterium]
MVKKRLYTFLNTYSGWFIIIGLTAFPVLRLLSIQMNAMSSFTTYTVFSILGRALGLAGVTLFSLNFLLSIRHRVLEKFFYGLNKVYAAHH